MRRSVFAQTLANPTSVSEFAVWRIMMVVVGGIRRFLKNPKEISSLGEGDVYINFCPIKPRHVF